MIFAKKLSNLYLLLLPLLMFINCNTIKGQTSRNNYIYRIDDFGARSNDKVDDTKSIQSCLDAASKTGGMVIFSSGNYISKAQLNINLATNARSLTIDGNNANIINNSLPKSIIGIMSDAGKSVRIQNLNIDGQVSKETRQNRTSGLLFTTGIDVRGFDSVQIESCRIQNIYGNGIYVNLRRYKDASILRAKEYVYIYNNEIYNCSGLNNGSRKDEKGRARLYDNYGDGILYTGGNSGLIANNKVINDLSTVGLVGRAGIALSYYNRNVTIKENEVRGYDRGLHIETTYGGHQALKNTISDCNIAYVNSALECEFIQNNPSIVDGNIITDGIYDYDKHGHIMRPYSQIFFYRSCKLGKGTIVRNNKCSMNQQRYKFSYYLLSSQEDLYIENNEFISKYPGVGTILLHTHTKTLVGNKLVNLYNVQARSTIDEVRNNEIIGKLNSVVFN